MANYIAGFVSGFIANIVVLAMLRLIVVRFARYSARLAVARRHGEGDMADWLIAVRINSLDLPR